MYTYKERLINKADEKLYGSYEGYPDCVQVGIGSGCSEEHCAIVIDAIWPDIEARLVMLRETLKAIVGGNKVGVAHLQDLIHELEEMTT